MDEVPPIAYTAKKRTLTSSFFILCTCAFVLPFKKTNTTQMLSASNRNLELDALRGIAALMVYFFHVTHGAGEWIDFTWGNTGVDLFFIISGYVIFLSVSKGSSLSTFIKSRFIRLFPTYWFSATLSYLLIHLYFKITSPDFAIFPFVDYLINLSMLQHFFGIANIDQPYWTLAVELQFYVIIAVLLASKQLKHIHYIALAISAVSVVLRVYASPTEGIDYHRYFPFSEYSPLFFIGILFYQKQHKGIAATLFYPMLALQLFMQYLLFPSTGREIFLPHIQYMSAILLFIILFFLLSSNMLSFLKIRPLLFLGEISYALYLTHQFIAVNLLMPLCLQYFHLNFWVSALLITLPLCLLTASVITFYVQYPIAKWLRKKLVKS